MLSPEQSASIANVRRLVSRFAELELEVPETLRGLVQTYEVAESYEAPPAPSVEELSELEAAEVAAAIERLADAEVRREASVRVKGELLARIGRALIREARSAAPELVDSLAAKIAPTASAFTTTVRSLPAGYRDPAAVLAAGADAGEAYRFAQSLGSELEDARTLRDALGRLGATAEPGGDLELGSRYCRVRNTGSARRVAEKIRHYDGRNPLGLFAELLEVAGVEDLHFPTLRDQRRFIEKLPAVEDHYEQRGIGQVKVEA